jgi:hypothetical protein
LLSPHKFLDLLIIAGESACGAPASGRFAPAFISASTPTFIGGGHLRMIPIPQTNQVQVKSGFAVLQHEF